MEYPLDPTREILKWGPTPVYPLLRYDTCATGLFITFPALYPGYSWPKSLVLSNTDRFIWMCEHDEIRAHGEKLFLEMMLPKEKREQVRAAWKRSLAELNRLEDVIGKGVDPFSDADLAAMWTEFHRVTDTFWAHASLPELSNYGSSELLARKLEGIVPSEEIAAAMEVLCAPEGMSFYQEEEIDLAETENVGEHQKKYFWLKNSYANVEVLPLSFFEERKNEIPGDIRKAVSMRLADIHQKKDALQEKYQLPQELRDMGDAIGDGIHWQDTRKKDIWIYLHYEDLMLQEIARRVSADANLLAFAMHEEIPRILAGDMSAESLRPRLVGAGIFAEYGNIELISTEDAAKYWEIYAETKGHEDTSEFRGVIASKGAGAVWGKVRIVLDPHGDVVFTPGDILVTTMTTPEFIFVMKKAAAIVTDTGGLTSHAAIVSRELGVPCIVGTKIATQVLKDGDLVEVDAEKGVVRIIK